MQIVRTVTTVSALALLVMAGSSAAQNPDAGRPPTVAEADPLTPEEQLKTFHLPPGFEIQLVVAEPDIYKPMNMNFDAEGRLWVTHSTEYPYPAGEASKADQSPRDLLTVISGIGADGRPETVQTFAEGLNIPIGVLPTHQGVLTHSIPNVYRFADTTGDGRADERTTLLTGVGYEDTHGMTNSFTHWVDGWVYAQHGFRNTSMIEDRAGNKLPLQSGNAYRFRPDGHGLEQWSHGQVNPFGLAFDPLGNLYSADCHTRPVYMLLRGAYYPSFGQPHDGLGFGPEMIDHYHGSTGIAGIIYYEATQFPPRYRDCLYVGNVVTRRIHRDRLEQHGSTYLTDTQEEFLTSDDPWFRPVDVQLGPDGALYILDFYNAIIGHYEVPLDHPDRDHFRGRIWRIVYTGTDEVEPEHNAHAGQFDLTTHDAEELVADLGSPNLTVRTFATHQLVERLGSEAAQPVRRIMTPRSIPAQRAHGLWVLHRLGELDDALVKQLADDEERIVRVHLMKALGEREGWSDSVGEIVRAATEDTDPFVRRAAADALGRHPAEANVMPLLNLWGNAPAEDTHLIHQTRISLRDQMLDPAIARAMMERTLSAEHQARLAEVAIAAPNPVAASFVLQYVEETQGIAGDQLDAYLRFAANNLPLDRIDVLGRLMRERFSDEPAFQLSVLRSIQQGLATQGVEPTSELRDWASEVVSVTLDRHAGQAWTNHAAPDFPDSPSPWAIEERPSSDGQTARLLSSLPLGEQRTGVLRSHTIQLPAEITFYMAGHNGPTSEEAVVKNFIRLRHAETNEVLAESLPPRNDTAQPYKWDLQAYEGEPAFIEITDADDASGYAWLAVGRFDPPLVKVPDVGPGEQMARQETAFQLAAVFGLHEVVDLVAAHLADAHLPVASRRVAGETLTRIDPAAAVAPLAKVLHDLQTPNDLSSEVARMLGQINSDSARDALHKRLLTATLEQGVPIAAALAGTAQGAESLLDAVENGLASPHLLARSRVLNVLHQRDLADLEQRIAALTDGLPAADERLTQVIEHHLRTFDRETADAAHGRTIFAQQCAACHQIDGVGGNIGPELEGAGNRGVARLLEDILAPNRAVDPAFRMSVIELEDGRTVTGMIRRSEGQVLIVADVAGQEERIPQSSVANRTALQLSLMPAIYADALPEEDLHALLAYLLKQSEDSE